MGERGGGGAVMMEERDGALCGGGSAVGEVVMCGLDGGLVWWCDQRRWCCEFCWGGGYGGAEVAVAEVVLMEWGCGDVAVGVAGTGWVFGVAGVDGGDDNDGLQWW
ncbi:hypothetical protein F0562_007683 [Nyssa sinensis]|uniref:Uncharacterized protein n=1 Tax=Nyssa sinensis TaxID=561372 RepID=A0A5J5A730_9ASTE|nr:hypothetical protein F0562_007683 [Nyssa sinensis]